jgi:hypothetical protein
MILTTTGLVIVGVILATTVMVLAVQTVRECLTSR